MDGVQHGPRDADLGDVIDAIIETGGDPRAAGLVGRIMEHNARSNASLLDSLLEGEIRAHEQTKQRLYALQDQLDLINERVTWLLGGPFPMADYLEREDLR